MKRIYKRELNLNKSSVGCAPCLKEALNMNENFKKKSSNEIKIDKIKNIVRSIFKEINDDKKT